MGELLVLLIGMVRAALRDRGDLVVEDLLLRPYSPSHRSVSLAPAVV